MEIAPKPAIIEAMRVTPCAPAAREAERPRPRPKLWLAPAALARGLFIDLLV